LAHDSSVDRSNVFDFMSFKLSGIQTDSQSFAEGSLNLLENCYLILLLHATGSISSTAVEDVFNFNKHETFNTFNIFIL
jgi:hypothetical protein